MKERLRVLNLILISVVIIFLCAYSWEVYMDEISEKFSKIIYL